MLHSKVQYYCRSIGKISILYQYYYIYTSWKHQKTYGIEKGSRKRPVSWNRLISRIKLSYIESLIWCVSFPSILVWHEDRWEPLTWVYALKSSQPLIEFEPSAFWLLIWLLDPACSCECGQARVGMLKGNCNMESAICLDWIQRWCWLQMGRHPWE